ncbi:MAG: DUF4783 domain-containing protein [Bacteroidales bacterium]|nr:DUF4783 domain-containing protein [Bacteroidales bacterium]
MKILLSVLFIFSNILISNASNFFIGNITEDISTAIRNGNAKDLAKYFDSAIDLDIPGSEGTYSKSQAEIILKDFFDKYPPKSYKVNHEGSSKDGSQYSIGTYTSLKKSFKTYYLVKKKSDKLLIQHLQFEED